MHVGNILRKIYFRSERAARGGVCLAGEQQKLWVTFFMFKPVIRRLYWVVILACCILHSSERGELLANNRRLLFYVAVYDRMVMGIMVSIDP